MKTAFILTGSTSGIGQALSHLCTDQGNLVVGISRRHDDSVRAHYVPFLWDMRERFATRSDDLLVVLDRISQDNSIEKICLVNNAATLGTVGPLLKQSTTTMRETMDVNFFAPRDLTLAVANFCSDQKKSLRVLSVSTGAASVAIAGWSEYCASKAAFDLWFRSLHLETSKDFKSAVFYPGVVDTPMQALIRGFDAKQFPEVARFHDLKNTGQLLSSERVARIMIELIGDSSFGEKPSYDVRD